MKIEIDVDIRPFIHEAKKQFRDLSASEVNKGIARTLNQMIAKAKVQASKSIRGTYKIRAAEIKSKINAKKANRTTLTALLMVSMRPLPLYAFNPKQTAKGVTVNVMGQRMRIKSAFIATMKSGHVGVFARGGYDGKDFVFRKTRKIKTGPDLPIEELVTASPFSMITNKRVAKELNTKLATEFPSALIKQLTKVREGY